MIPVRSALLLLTLSSSALAGQTAAPPPAAHGPDIVVTGRRPSTKAEIRHLTRQVTPVGDATEAIARFNQPVCVQSIGMTSVFNERVVKRVSDDAQDAGITVDKPGCRPNITIVFIENGQALVREIQRSHVEWFGDMEPGAVRKLVADPGPVHSWTLTETTSRDGDRMRVGTTTGVRAPELQVRSASIIQSTTKRDIVTTIVVIDIPAAMGKHLNQIADYAAMRTLAQTRNAAGAGSVADTILRLFDPGDSPSPPSLTAFDRGYLKSLYEGQATTPSLTKVSEMAARINQALAGAVAPEK